MITKAERIANEAREAALRFKRSGVSKEDFLRQSAVALKDMGLTPDAEKGVMAVARIVADEVYGE